MVDDFSEYKKTIEGNLINTPFLYSGDVISSSIHKYSEVKHTPLVSPSFVINCISKIYQMSFDKLVEKSKEVILSEDSVIRNLSPTENFLDKLVKIGMNPHFIFVSNKSAKLLGIKYNIINNRPLPYYFYEIEKYIGINLDVLICPNIEEIDGETVMFVTDKPIQSLVYTIQNMDYKVTPIEDETKDLMSWIHEIEFNFYDCDYVSNKILIKNLSKIRDDKINKLLNGD